MSRALPITQRQAQTLLRAAEAEKGIVEVKIGSTVIRLIPASLAQSESRIDDPTQPEDFQSLEQYRAWRERHGGSED